MSAPAAGHKPPMPADELRTACDGSAAPPQGCRGAVSTCNPPAERQGTSAPCAGRPPSTAHWPCPRRAAGADALSRYVDWRDRGTCILFGDGCGALVLTAREDGSCGLLGIDMHSGGWCLCVWGAECVRVLAWGPWA